MEVVTTVPAAPVMDIKALLHSTAHAPEALQLVLVDQAAATAPIAAATVPIAAAAEADAVTNMEPIIGLSLLIPYVSVQAVPLLAHLQSASRN